MSGLPEADPGDSVQVIVLRSDEWTYRAELAEPPRVT